MILWIIISIIAAVALFFALTPVEDALYDEYEENFAEQKTDQAMNNVQKYIDAHNLSTDDVGKFGTVLKKNDLSSLQLFYDGLLIYNFSYGNKIDESFADEDSYALWEKKYDLTFSDVEVTAYTDGVSSSQFANFLFIIRILLSVLLFFIFIYLAVRYILKRVKRLRKDIEMLETGNLDYEIRVDGRDEITELQKDLDQMRLSLKEQIDEEEYLLDGNKELITDMSHDLRTPLTAIMMYSDILKLHKFKTPTDADEYIDKIYNKASMIKRMTDNMFEYALVGMDNEVQLEIPRSFERIFYDMLSDFTGYLTDQGYDVKSDIDWPDVKIQVNMDYISRIFDNITSNILKYADKSDSISVSVFSSILSESGFAGISVENRIDFEASHDESTGIGTKSMTNMMHAMKGKLVVNETEEMYCVKIMFPVM